MNQGVSAFGISSLKWAQFDPTEHVGEKIQVTVDLLTKVRSRFTTQALLTAEMTTDASYLGMKFLLPPAERERLVAVIKQEGFCPTAYIRKYPRIPATNSIPNMPLRAIVRDHQDSLLVFDIANMSPNGILLYTENPRASFFVPTSRLVAQVEPRGEMFQSFEFEGAVCRVLLDRNPETGNMTRYLGIRFMRLTKTDKDNLLDILRAVLSNITINGRL